MKEFAVTPFIATSLTCCVLVAMPLIIGTSFSSRLVSPVLALFLAVWLPYSAFVIWKHKDRRRQQGATVAIWAMTIAALVGIHAYHAHMAEKAADQVLTKVLAYKAQRGVFPKSLEDVGLSTSAFKRTAHLLYGLAEDGAPHLSFGSAANPFDKYWYDFSSNAWQFKED